MVDPPDLFLAPQFQTPVADRPSLRSNILLWMRPDIVAALLALLFAIRLYLLQPGLKSRRVPGFEVCRREFRMAAATIVVRCLRQAAHRTFPCTRISPPPVLFPTHQGDEAPIRAPPSDGRAHTPSGHDRIPA